MDSRRLSGWFRLYAANTDGTDGQININPVGAHTDDFSLSADGTFVIYATGSDWGTTHTLYRVNIDGTGNQLLVDNLATRPN